MELSTLFDRILKSIDPKIHSYWATSAEDAIDSINLAAKKRRQKPYDLIIADIFLDGEFTGLDIWQHCALQYPDVPVVITSAIEIEKFMASIEPQNGRYPSFLQKPFSVSTCHRLLKSILNYQEKQQGDQPKESVMD